jgi:spore coat protein H
MKYIIFFISAILFYSCDVTDYNPVNELSGVKIVSLFAEDEDLERLLNNRHTSIAVPVKVNFEGETHAGVLRASGAGSRYFPKFSFRVILDNSSIMGVRDFSLSAQPSDPTYVKTAVASYLYKAYDFPVFFSEPVFVTVNNKNYGIYNFIERINEDFFRKRNVPVRELYKVMFEAKFSFLKENRLEANFEKEIPDDDNFSSLANMIIASDAAVPEDIQETLGRHMDIDNYLWYHAISTIRSDPDSYSNNFYIYKRSYESPFMFIPWDFDRTFTGDVGLYGENELIESLIRNQQVLTSYKTKLKDIAERVFTEDNLYPLIDSYYQKLKPYYSLDPYLENKDIIAEINFIKEFITLRRNKILNLGNYGEN